MTNLSRTILATMRQVTGKRYPTLELMLDTMTESQHQDFLRLIRDIQESETHRLQGQAARMGIPKGVLR
jgi:hypothetical protein